MKRVLCVFAHPDDEAFGPGGTIAVLSKEAEVYVICVTNGEMGMNSSDKSDPLAEVRRNELLGSTKILGVKEVFFLGYKDGTLSNNLYHEIAEKIQEKVKELKPEMLLTYDMRGVSGHLDHIAVSLITRFVFEHQNHAKELWLYGVRKEVSDLNKDYFVYFPEGFTDGEIDKVVYTAGVWEQKVAAMQQHETQKHDVDRILKRQKDMPKEENFIVVRKD